MPRKVFLVKAMVFPVVIHGCASRTIKKVECQRINAFEVWCCRRLLGVPWTARRSNQSTLKEINPECSVEGLMLKLKLQYSGHLMWKADSLEKTLMLGKIEARRRRGWQRMRWLDGITKLMDQVWVSSGVGDGKGSLVCCSPWGCKKLVTTEWLNWTELRELFEVMELLSITSVVLIRTCIIHLKLVNFIVCTSHLNKGDFKMANKQKMIHIQPNKSPWMIQVL